MAEPDWLRLQKKIFGRYVQQKLRSGGVKHEVKDIIQDVQDGLLLIELLEVLSGKQYPSKKPGPAKSKIQKIDNCNKTLEFINKTCGIKTTISAEELSEGNEKLVLGCIFQIIVKFLKFDEDGETSGDVKDALMLWLKNKTAGYAHVSIENFTKSFHDGLAFCALIHKMRPKLIPYDSLVQSDKTGNLTLALDTAAKYCNVEKYLEPEDIAKLDEVSMIVYLSDWYYGVALLQKQDISAKRIGKLVLLTELHDKMRADYIAGATTLNDWVQAKITELSQNVFDNTLAGVQKQLASFYDYKANEKSSKLSVQLDLESLFDNLALRLVNNKRPAFQPPSNLTGEAINKSFEELEKAELAKSGALHTELARQIRLHNQAKKFKAGTDSLKAWVAEKNTYFGATESIESVESAEIHLESLGVQVTEVHNAKEGRWKDLKQISGELYNEKFENESEIRAIESEVEGHFAQLESAGQGKKAVLEGELAKQLAINDKLCSDFAAAIKGFTDWLSSKKAAISSNKDAELEKQLADLDASTADHSVADDKLAQIGELDEKLKARSITNNKYTNVTKGDVASQWSQFGLVLKKKRELLESQIEEKKKSGLTDEQLQEIKDNFVYFDKDKTNFLERRELRPLLQSLGEDATPKDIDAVLAVYDEDKDGKIRFEEFQKFMFTKLGDSNTKDEIVQSFKYLSFEKDFITEEELVSVINDLSWKQRHVDYLKKEMKPKTGGLDFETWTEEVFAR